MLVFVILFYFILLIGIGLFSYRKTKGFDDFFVARKKGGYWSISGSLAATILGGSAVIGATNAAPETGWAIWWYMLCASMGLFALIPFLPHVYKLGKYTLPDLLGKKHGPVLQTVSSYIIPIAWTGVTATQIIASAKLLESFINLDYHLGVLLSGAVFVAYTMAGGQISILKTDFFQAILVIGGIALIAFFAYRTPTKSMITPISDGWPTNANFSALDIFVLILTYATTFTTGPDIYSRIFSARDTRVAKKAVTSVAIILIPLGFLLAFIGVYGTVALEFPERGALLIDVCKSILPKWAVAFAAVALLSAVLSSADTTLLSASVIVTGLLQKGNYGKNTMAFTRIVMLAVGAISVVIALNFTSIIQTLLIALTIYSGAFTIPIIWALLNVEVKQSYMVVAMAQGGIFALSGKIVSLFTSADWGNYILIMSFLVSVVIALLGTRKKTKAIPDNAASPSAS